MALRRKGPSFPKFISGTLTRRGIMRNEDRDPARRKKREEPTFKWQPEAKAEHERLMRENNFNENKVWDTLREKFGLKVFSLFQELSQKNFSNTGELKRALVAIEIRFLSKMYPHVNIEVIVHQAVKDIRSLGL